MIDMEFDKEFLEKLFEKAAANPNLQQTYDLESTDSNLRMFNALLPGTVVPIHRHERTSETIICLYGKVDAVIYKEVVSYNTTQSGEMLQSMDTQDFTRKVEYSEVKRIPLCPTKSRYGCQISQGVWHAIDVIEPSVIFVVRNVYYK